MIEKPKDVVLFGSPLSPFVDKVARALRLKGIPYTLVEPRTPFDLGRWNPQTGKMPVLEVDGTREYDSTFILRRLDARVPEPFLYAAAAPTAARQRLLEDWSDEALYWYGMALRWCDVNAPATAEQVASTLPAPAFLRPVLRLVLRRQIGSQAPFFFAAEPSAADLAVGSQLRMLESGPTPQGAELIADRAALVDYLERVDGVAKPA